MSLNDGQIKGLSFLNFPPTISSLWGPISFQAQAALFWGGRELKISYPWINQWNHQPTTLRKTNSKRPWK